MKYYLTTPIYYPSGYLHLGHTYSTIVADSLKRFREKQGYEVFFTTGTDEHGMKMEETAKKAGVPVMDYVDNIVASTKELWKTLDIRYDKFIRTTDKAHTEAVQKIFTKLYEKGEIYKGEYEGKYCKPCESFFTEAQLVDGKCPDCGREVTDAKEESYFFRLSAYKDRLLKLYEDNETFIMPEFRKAEMVKNFVEDLEDLAVTRSSFSWGVPVPFDEKHVIYVWIDALSCYLTALGYGSDDESNFRKFWPADVHIVGKEINRFHTVIWPAMLMALDLPIPKMVFAHGWILFDEDKMSKSKGNVVYPEPILDLYGMDALRYFMLREFSFGQDGNFTKEKFLSRYNSDLANDLGNLLSRTISMIEKYTDGVIPAPEKATDYDAALEEVILSTKARMEGAMEHLTFSKALAEVFATISRANKYIDETMPWVLAKEGRTEELASVLYHLVHALAVSATLLSPFMEETSKKITSALGIEPVAWDDTDKANVVRAGAKVHAIPALFPRLDIEAELVRWDEANKELARSRGLLPPEVKPLEHKAEISFEDWEKLELRVGLVEACEAHPKADRLLVSKVRLGSELRTIVSGIREHYAPEDMVGRRVVVLCNLPKRKIRGIESEGMLLVGQDDAGMSLLTTAESVEPGAEVG